MTREEYEEKQRRLDTDLQSASRAYAEARKATDHNFGLGVSDETARKALSEARYQLDKVRFEAQRLRVNRSRLVCDTTDCATEK